MTVKVHELKLGSVSGSAHDNVISNLEQLCGFFLILPVGSLRIRADYDASFVYLTRDNGHYYPHILTAFESRGGKPHPLLTSIGGPSILFWPFPASGHLLRDYHVSQG